MKSNSLPHHSTSVPSLLPRVGSLALFSLAFVSSALAADKASSEDADGWVRLFNGKDLTGWSAHTGGGGDKSSQKADEIFTVKDGVIHIYQSAEAGSKQSSANLVHDSVWQYFHLQVEYRWLETKFQPRTKDDRDAGILFHIHTDPDHVWPPSLEMQLADGKPGSDYVTGDLFVLGATRADSTSKGQSYDAEGQPIPRGQGVPGGMRTKVTLTADRPAGEWNIAEVIVHGSKSAEFLLNGKLLNKISNMKFKDKDGNWQPLEKGQVSIQAEWAELEYRMVRIKELND